MAVFVDDGSGWGSTLKNWWEDTSGHISIGDTTLLFGDVPDQQEYLNAPDDEPGEFPWLLAGLGIGALYLLLK